jgi:WD40 repeat protein
MAVRPNQTIKIIASREEGSKEPSASFTLDLDTAKTSLMLKMMLDISNKKSEIQLPEIKSAELEVLVGVMALIRAAQQEKKSHEEIQQRILKFIGNINNLEQLSNLLMAANFMDIPEALSAVAHKISIDPQLRADFMHDPNSLNRYAFANVDELSRMIGEQITPRIYGISQEITALQNVYNISLNPDFSQIIAQSSQTTDRNIFSNTTALTLQEDGTYALRLVKSDNRYTMFAACNKQIILAFRDGTREVWTQQPDGAYTSRRPVGHGARDTTIAGIAATPDATGIVIRYEDGRVELWTLKDDGTYNITELPNPLEMAPFRKLVAITPDKTGIVADMMGTGIRLWTKQPDGMYVRKDLFAANQGGITSLAISNDNSVIVAGDAAGNANVWIKQASGDHKLQHLDENMHDAGFGVTPVATTSNGSRILIGAKFLQAWDKQTNGSYALTTPHGIIYQNSPITSISTTLHGERVAIGTKNGIILLVPIKKLNIKEALFVEHCLQLPQEKRRSKYSQEKELRKWNISQSKNYKDIFEQLVSEQPELATYLRQFLIIE